MTWWQSRPQARLWFGIRASEATITMIQMGLTWAVLHFAAKGSRVAVVRRGERHLERADGAIISSSP
ncbi:MAG: hypothetical protein H6Q86_1313 [candidate division NC10 bacterium]|nr:hypothetical protein [candidate division NC10 bacterium]